jgi:hypothetical protein
MGPVSWAFPARRLFVSSRSVGSPLSRLETIRPLGGVPRLCFPGFPKGPSGNAAQHLEELGRPSEEREPTQSGLAPETP